VVDAGSKPAFYLMALRRAQVNVTGRNKKPEPPLSVCLPCFRHYQKNNHGLTGSCELNMHKLLQEQGCCGYIHALLTL